MKKLPALLLSLAALSAFGQAAAIAPRLLWNPADAKAISAQFQPDQGVACKADGGAFTIEVAAGENAWPGFSIVPDSGAAWDLSPWGHVEALVTNLTDKKLGIGLRVDNDGDWKDNPWNSENIYLDAGKSGTVKVIFGYQYGFQRGFRLDPSKVVRVKLFLLGKSGEARSFKVENLVANGPAKEKPMGDPNKAAISPEGGNLLPRKAGETTAVRGDKGAAAEFTAKGALAVTLGDKPGAAVFVHPEKGFWNLGSWLCVKAQIRNTGTTPLRPVLRIANTGDTIESDEGPAIAPGKTGLVEVSFLPKKPWVGIYTDGKGGEAAPGTVVKFDSHRVKGLQFAARDPGASFEVLACQSQKVLAPSPKWLGKRPPDGIEGEWKLTFHDEFNDKEVDQNVWNIYTANYWDARTHFTKDDIELRDGNLVLRYEQKRGHHNDDPEGAVTDFAAGFADSYGKWTQTYGYFEARMKLPRCPGLWPAFWMMPDRGEALGPQWKRASTSDGGMEFDIMEHLTAWGPYRFNIAAHWDGYGKEHKSLGSTWVYVPTDKDEYFTIGLLWLPGKIVYYGNGVEFARWENDRICDQPSYPIFYIVQGGWANVPLDEDCLPAEFLIDYIRVWQRTDLIK